MKTIIAMIAIAILVELGHTQEVLHKPPMCGVFKNKPKEASRIVNGEAVIPHTRPYQVLLLGFFPNGTAKFYCGGSLVRDTHVLTAAHCVVGNEPKNLRIYPGLHNFDLSQLTMANGVPVRQYYAHKSYNAQSLINDVAVIRLQIKIEADQDKVGFICLADQSTPVCKARDPVVASGWGATTGNPKPTGPTRPTVLQQVALECVDRKHSNCTSVADGLLGFIQQDKSKMCAYAHYKGVCFGDSGGPCVREKTHTDGTKYLEQVGIMSGTVDCSFTKPKPDIYADVRYFYSWILDQIKASIA